MKSLYDWLMSSENGAPGAIRTPDPQIRSLMLYPAELRVQWGRFNPAASAMQEGKSQSGKVSGGAIHQPVNLWQMNHEFGAGLIAAL